MTRRLAAMSPGTLLEVWGPLGNGFPADRDRAPGDGRRRHRADAVSGAGPASTSAADATAIRRGRSRPAAKVTLCYGVADAEYLAGVDDFRRCGVDVRLSTDDGSAGHHGLVTELIEPVVATVAASAAASSAADRSR